MSERRFITSYNPRLVIPISEMSEHPGEYAFYCLPVDGANALRRIIAYLDREVTYIYQEVDGKHYLGPTTAELEAFRDIAAETEDFLMSGCDLSSITDAIDTLTDAVVALQCICTTLNANASSGVLGSDIMTLVDDGEVIPSDQLSEVTYPPQTYANACAISQLYYAWTWEVVTEVVLPAMRGTFDHLIPVLAALVGTATGGIGFIPMYLIAEAIQELIEIGYDAAETNLVNWLFSVKDEWVCLAFEMLITGATDREVADAIKTGITDPSESISFGDKTIVSFVGAAWAVQAAATAWSNQTAWALENVTAGYCDTCDVPPEDAVLFDCAVEHWNTFGNPEWLGCVEGKPYATAGYIRWQGEMFFTPSGHFLLEINWTAYGGTPSTIGIDIFDETGSVQVNISSTPQQTEGWTGTTEWEVDDVTIANMNITVQIVKENWYGIVNWWRVTEW